MFPTLKLEVERVKENILGYDVEALSVCACADEIDDLLRTNSKARRDCGWLACMNPHSYVLSLGDDLFSQALKGAEWLVADGIGIVLASRMLGGAIPERVTGSDIFHKLNERMNVTGGMSVFFIGSTKETLELICKRMAIDYPNILIAGTYSPPFKSIYTDAELNSMIDAINAKAPDVLWVGMTAPKQEKWIYQNRNRLKVKFAGAIGGAFDFYSGRVKRSNPIFQRHGLEWLPRLLQQPKRLWRRMFISAPIFIWHVAQEYILNYSRK